MAHAKDRDVSGRFVPAGQGIIDFDYFISALNEVGFAGPIVVHGLDPAEAPSAKRMLYDLLEKHGCLE